MPIPTEFPAQYSQGYPSEQPQQFLPDDAPLSGAVIGPTQNYTPPPLPPSPSQDAVNALIAALQQNTVTDSDRLKQAFAEKGLDAGSKGDTFGSRESADAAAINSLPIMPSNTNHQGVQDFYNSLPLGSLYREAETKNGKQIPTGVIKRKVSPDISNIAKDPSVTKGGLTGFAEGLANSAIGNTAKDIGGWLAFTGLGNSIRDWGLSKTREAQADSGWGNFAGQMLPMIAAVAATRGAAMPAVLGGMAAGNSLADTTESNSSTAQNIENAALQGAANAALGAFPTALNMGANLGKDVVKSALLNAALGSGTEEAQHLIDPQNNPNNVGIDNLLFNMGLGGLVGAAPHVLGGLRASIAARGEPVRTEPTNIGPEAPPTADVPTRENPPIEPNVVAPEQTAPTPEQTAPAAEPAPVPEEQPVRDNAPTEQAPIENNVAPSPENQRPVTEDIPAQEIPDYSDNAPLPKSVDDVIKQSGDGAYERNIGLYKTYQESINASLDNYNIPDRVVPRINTDGGNLNSIRRNFNQSLNEAANRINGPDFANAPQEVKDVLMTKINNAKTLENRKILPDLINSYEKSVNNNIPENRIAEMSSTPNSQLMEMARDDTEQGKDARIVLQTRRHIDELLNLNHTQTEPSTGTLRLANNYKNYLDDVHNSSVFENFGIRRSANMFRPFEFAPDEDLNELASNTTNPAIRDVAQIEQAVRNPQQEHLQFAYDDLTNKINRLNDRDLKEIINSKGGDPHNPYNDVAKVIASNEIERRNSLSPQMAQVEADSKPRIVNC